MNANEVRNLVAGTLANLMENADPSAWVMPWFGGNGLPTNAKTGNQYRGGNVWSLLLGADRAGFGSVHWATYKQWQDLGRQVMRGEKATYGVKWVFPTEDSPPTARAFPRAFSVHNFAQTQASDNPTVEVWNEPIKETGTAETIAAAENYVAASGAVVNANGARAFYSPSHDAITIPAVEAFHTTEGYYATLLHELTHWTGAETRLARECAKNYKTDPRERAREELIAELGAAMLCGTLGIVQEPREEAAQYLASWASLLRNDANAFWTAASLADKACAYLDELAGVEVSA